MLSEVNISEEKALEFIVVIAVVIAVVRAVVRAGVGTTMMG